MTELRIEEFKVAVENLLRSDEDVLNELVQTFQSWNGKFSDEVLYEMEMLDEFFHDMKPTEFLPRVFYGYDADTSHEDNRTEFNPNRNYFYFNGYGNLVSTDYIDYYHLIDDCVESIDELDYDWLPSDIQELFDEYDSEEE